MLMMMPSGVLAVEKKQAPPSTPVHTAPVREGLVSRQVSVIGTTEAFRRSTVAAEVSGRVEALHIREGDFVKKGTPHRPLKVSTLPMIPAGITKRSRTLR